MPNNSMNLTVRPVTARALRTVRARADPQVMLTVRPIKEGDHQCCTFSGRCGQCC